jgi:large subunit ribosomal protein L17
MKPPVKGFLFGYWLSLIGFFVFFWWATREKGPKVERVWITVEDEGEESPNPVQPEMPAPVAELPKSQDDLTLIQGIGAKLADLLKQNGITTFVQLAETKVPFLEKILQEKNLAFIDPTRWPEEARLAAAGKNG